MGHKENGTVCEVIPDRLLTNILWLKDPTLKLPLKVIISAHSQDLFIRRRIWDKFYDVLQEVRQEGKVDDEKISTLFYQKYIELELRELNENEGDKITPEFVLEEIEKAGKFKEKILEGTVKAIEKDKDEEIDRRIKEKEKEFFQRLKQEVSKKEEQKDKERIEKILEIQKNLRDKADSSVRKWILGARFLFAGVFVILFLYILIKKDYATFDKISGVPALILSIFGLVGVSISRFWKKFQEKCVNKKYTKKIKEAGLYENE